MSRLTASDLLSFATLARVRARVSRNPPEARPLSEQVCTPHGQMPCGVAVRRSRWLGATWLDYAGETAWEYEKR